MTIKVLREQDVIREAAQVLMEHLEPAKAVRFWAAWQIGTGDYLSLREQLFGDETVATLFEKVQAYQEGADEAGEDNQQPSPQEHKLP